MAAILFLSRGSVAQPGLEGPPPPAVPEPPTFAERVFIRGGALVTVDHFLNAALAFDAGMRLGASPFAIHVTYANGGSLDADNGGDFWRATAGVEARSTRRSSRYGFLDLDLGYQRQTWGDVDDEFEVHRGGLAIARVGYDTGGRHWRVRAAFELYVYHRAFVDHATTWDTGGGITLALGYRR